MANIARVFDRSGKEIARGALLRVSETSLLPGDHIDVAIEVLSFRLAARPVRAENGEILLLAEEATSTPNKA